ncbi:MAG: VPLPA-CTERM sorting domain-containing protein [Gammaproteobacteria bacterium]|nr:VPLPA-CTERM sorting domain-containing protein [Gammaproteobacteria bacterium]
MTMLKFNNILLAAVLGLFAASPVLAATTYTFSQGGFDEGATVTGSFTGEDLDSDGQIVFFGDESRGPGAELTAFTLTFSGNSLVGGFTVGLSDLFGFVWTVGSAFIGDDASGAAEGIGVDNGLIAYYVGPGPAALCDGSQVCSSVEDFSSGEITESIEAVQVNPVPVPAAFPLLAGALGVLGFVGRRRRN